MHQPEPSKSNMSGFSDPARVYIEMSAADRATALRMTRMFFAAALVASLSLVGNIYQAQLPREIPYVLRENANGSLDTGSVVHVAERPDILWIKYQLSRWITECRSVTSDPHIQNIFDDHTALFITNTSGAAPILAAYYKHRQLMPDHMRVGVQINFVRPRAANDHVYEADWTENMIDEHGTVVTKEHWNAMISVDFDSANITLASGAGDDPDYNNPYGMFISDISWNRENS